MKTYLKKMLGDNAYREKYKCCLELTDHDENWENKFIVIAAVISS